MDLPDDKKRQVLGSSDEKKWMMIRDHQRQAHQSPPKFYLTKFSYVMESDVKVSWRESSSNSKHQHGCSLKGPLSEDMLLSILVSFMYEGLINQLVCFIAGFFAVEAMLTGVGLFLCPFFTPVVVDKGLVLTEFKDRIGKQASVLLQGSFASMWKSTGVFSLRVNDVNSHISCFHQLIHSNCCLPLGNHICSLTVHLRDELLGELLWSLSR